MVPSMLMSHPENTVLVCIETCERGFLKTGHDGHFHLG